jgi:dihydropteroate synthase
MLLTDLHPAKHWKLRTRTLDAGRLPLLMGIVNITPDSFSDGGHSCDADMAVERGLRLAAEGADILDVGGESTRPDSEPVDAQEELRRVIPVVGALCRQTKLPVSVDTSKALVARHAIHAGAEIINDVTALTGDPAMLPLAVETGAAVCAMHMQGVPRTMQENPTYADVVAEVREYLRQRRDALLAAGVDPLRIALDPGIGFGKTTDHNIQLLANAWQLHSLGCPVLVGHSRKRFLGDAGTQPTTDRQRCGGSYTATPGATVQLSPQQPVLCQQPAPLQHPAAAGPSPLAAPAFDRTAGTIGVALSLARQGVQILRVHDVAAVRQALLLFQATGGLA